MDEKFVVAGVCERLLTSYRIAKKCFKGTKDIKGKPGTTINITVHLEVKPIEEWRFCNLFKLREKNV